VVAAGWLASTAAAAAGAAAGSIIGALTQAGVSEDAHAYAEGVRRGGTLVTVRVPDADRARYDAILSNASVDIGVRRTAWQKTGWSRFDPAAPSYGVDDVLRERELYGSQHIV
jgi:hypothetical protein